MPECPPNYECTFIPNRPSHIYDHWWDGPWGQWLALAGIIALVIVLCVIAYHIAEARKATRDTDYRVTRQDMDEREARAKRSHELAMAEQLTMQLDTAKDNPEMLAWVDRHRRG